MNWDEFFNPDLAIIIKKSKVRIIEIAMLTMTIWLLLKCKIFFVLMVIRIVKSPIIIIKIPDNVKNILSSGEFLSVIKEYPR